ncbi:MAG: DNA mismatch repair protein MutS [Christensenellaceae bacterium]
MALSQMMKHYLEMKEKYKDCIVFYRLGDFYEMFFEDAKEVSSLLDLTLTGRDCGLEERAPMCGIPFHAADGYIAKLVALGKKVAICEQLTDPAESKGLVERDVVRVVTAGTLTEESFLDEKSNNYIACVSLEENGSALAWADITTGEFCVTEYTGETAIEDTVGYLMKIGAVEVLCNDQMALKSAEIKEVQKKALPPFSCYVPWAFQVRHAEKTLLEQFGVASLAPFGLAGRDNCVSAAGALIEYLKETQKHALKNITGIRYHSREAYMMLDSIAIRNLELTRTLGENKRYGSLLWLLDRTRTGMGARLLASMILSPLRSKERIEYRQNGVKEFFDATVVRMGLSDILHNVRDVERLAGKISNGNLTPKDCVALASSLAVLPSVRLQLSGFTSDIVREIVDGLPDMSDIEAKLSAAIEPEAPAVTKDGGYIRSGYCKELDELRRIRANGKSIIAEIEVRERERTGIRTLKIGYNRVFGYYIEVSKSFRDKVPYDYQRRQTLTTGERYVTEELKEIENKILTSEDKCLKIEESLFTDLKNLLLERLADFKNVSQSIAMLDVLVSLATVAKENKYVCPTIVPSEEALEITEGRHPVVEAISKEKFVPNDTLLDSAENRTMVLTGPNMAGKSTYMRQTALIVLMAHIGSFVPARAAKVPVVDRIFTRVGASDNLIYDQSTFMVEMTEVASILLNATSSSLLILDEVGRGTSTYDGLSIAWAVIEYLNEHIRAKTLFATHYHELTELEGRMEGVKNYKVTVREMNGTVLFLRRIARGGANKSFGVEVAALAGIPKDVTARAKEILKKLERSDIARNKTAAKEEVCEAEYHSEVESVLRATDVNALTPMQAMMLLAELKEKLNG